MIASSGKPRPEVVMPGWGGVSNHLFARFIKCKMFFLKI